MSQQYNNNEASDFGRMILSCCADAEKVQVAKWEPAVSMHPGDDGAIVLQLPQQRLEAEH